MKRFQIYQGLCSTFFVCTAVFSYLSEPLHAVAEEPSAAGNEISTVADMLTEGKAYMQFRYRFETVDDDTFDKDAYASTLRTRLGYQTAELHGLRALIEVDNIQRIGNQLFNDTIEGPSDRPVVADPEGTEINQAYLDYNGISDSGIRLGRYRLILDNQRFIGDVGWRQNIQTYDGAQLTNTSLENTKLTYAYFLNVNRIFGDDSPVGDIESNAHLFNARWAPCEFAAATFYSYLLDLEDLPGLSTVSYGGRVDGHFDLEDDLAALYDLEYAYQTDYEDNPKDFDANYYRAGAGVRFGMVTVKAAYEVLGSDNGNAAFTTPLATLHGWNGWADKFLNTPDTGLRDASGTIAYIVDGVHDSIDGTALTAVFHQFTADDGGADYGTEWDFNITQKIFDNYSFGVKYANYNADDFSTDTQKLIFTLGASFQQT